jgi:hypothetical protein
MTTAGRTLDRMTCPTCGRQVAFRLIRDPRVSHGRQFSTGIRKPVRHKQQTLVESFQTVISDRWCPAGEPLRGG